MKTKSVLMATLATLLLASCSKDNNVIDEGQSGDVRYLALSITQPKTYGSTSTSGSPEESKISEGYAVLFNESGVVVSQSIVDATQASGTIGKNEAFAITGKNPKYLLFIANPSTELKNRLTIGKSYSEVNALLETTSIDEITVNDKFMMVNAGSLAGGEYDDTQSNGLLNITGYIKQTKELAQASPAKLAVDRLAAKVEVKSAASVVDKQGGEVEFKTWCLNTTNKKTTPYNNLVKYEGAGNYRIDHNYLNNANTGSFITDNFSVLKTMPANAKNVSTTGSIGYCFENTMQANQQQNGYSTSVVVEAVYTPKGVTKGKSYFVFHQKLYKDIAELDAALSANYLTLANLNKLATDYGYADWSDLKTNNPADLTNLEQKALASGITQDPIADILFYKKGINYYMQMIRHDDTVAQNKLGRWGVVRNNWYVLTLNSVNGFGTPNFPVVDPNTPNDKEGWLGVQISVNNWSMWQQAIDFE